MKNLSVNRIKKLYVKNVERKNNQIIIGFES